jgi:hypothetical protein
MGPGNNSIHGSALIRQLGGGVVTCAGLQVMLIPKNSYSSERMQAIYGSTERGFNPINRAVTFTNEADGYNESIRKVLCDAQGNFIFENVKDGQYFVATAIAWAVAQSTEGGSLMQAVNIKGGEKQSIVLSP